MHTTTHDVVIVGGGHNALTAAAYLAQSGASVMVLERRGEFGGAAVSADAFAGAGAWLSRYSYLVSLLPERIVRDLDLQIRLAPRRYSSFTPLPGTDRGLLVDTQDHRATSASFGRIGAAADAERYARVGADTAELARVLWPTVTEPLLTRSEARALVGDDARWSRLIEHPIGDYVEERLGSDLARGVVLTDAVIGTFAGAHDESLAQNRCFIYHTIGRGSGRWDVPVGGMGSVSGELHRAARAAGARLVAHAEVTSVSPDGEVVYQRGERERTVVGRHVLSGVAPYVLDGLLRAAGAEGTGAVRPEGSQVKVNMLVSRLPRLRDASIDPAVAFAGTLHVNETYSQLESAYRGAVRGIMPGLMPCEVYCHTLTDPSILDPELAATGAQTLTVFGLHTPDRWLTALNNDSTRERLQASVLASLDSVLAEPIADLLMTDADGQPCIETKTTVDLERELGMPGGNIFHGPLDWPFVEDDAELATAAERWGVATRHPRILLCGSGARRGGAVSGLGGHNAAMALLDAQL
jgi:phytoene dehydrogenase-like protein